MVKGITRISIVEDNILYSKKVPITHGVDLVRKKYIDKRKSMLYDALKR